MTQRRRTALSQETEESEWSRRLGRMSLAVKAWRERAENPVTIEPGSSLSADALEGLNVEIPVWYSMCISSEHLDFALDAMRATNTMYPTAYMTVAHTAFIAATNAVWVLTPRKRQECRMRALRFYADDLRV